MNSRLVTLYQHVLYKEMIDEQVARVLPALLRSYRITVSNKKIRSVVVCYEELEREDVAAVKDGVAYVPLFSSHPVLLFQDEYGNRYTDVSYRKQPGYVGKPQRAGGTLLRYLSGAAYASVERCSAIVKDGMKGTTDRRVLKRALAELKLHPLFREKLLESLLGYDSRCRSEEEGAAGVLDYWNQLKPEKLSRENRGKLIRHADSCREQPGGIFRCAGIWLERYRGKGTSGSVQPDDLKTDARVR